MNDRGYEFFFTHIPHMLPHILIVSVGGGRCGGVAGEVGDWVVDADFRAQLLCVNAPISVPITEASSVAEIGAAVTAYIGVCRCRCCSPTYSTPLLGSVSRVV